MPFRLLILTASCSPSSRRILQPLIRIAPQISSPQLTPHNRQPGSLIVRTNLRVLRVALVPRTQPLTPIKRLSPVTSHQRPRTENDLKFSCMSSFLSSKLDWSSTVSGFPTNSRGLISGFISNAGFDPLITSTGIKN